MNRTSRAGAAVLEHVIYCALQPRHACRPSILCAPLSREGEREVHENANADSSFGAIRLLVVLFVLHSLITPSERHAMLSAAVTANQVAMLFQRFQTLDKRRTGTITYAHCSHEPISLHGITDNFTALFFFSFPHFMLCTARLGQYCYACIIIISICK